MANIYLCFLWHMHQPFYKNLATGEYALPWTRMHALKDYYGMVRILEEFPDVHQTFNLVPSMIAQIDEYASGEAADPFLRIALKPAADLTSQEIAFLTKYFFQAQPEFVIGRYPRYAELHESRGKRLFNENDIRDLQVLSQLAWFDEFWLTEDEEIRGLVAKGSHYTQNDQALLGRKQIEVLRKVVPVYSEFAKKGQIEVSTTPYYHPILPLLCDSDIAFASHPGVPLPPRFQYPEDALHQLQTARDYCQTRLDLPVRGLWPSEGSVSDAALALAADCGFEWAASDNGVLARTLDRPGTPEVTYRPYLWSQGSREIRMLFRDHHLSDLIGFVYSRMDAEHAAQHFLQQIRENCRPILASGRDALVPIILDGENAWEHFPENGRPFLRRLYQKISEESGVEALTVSEALARVEPAPLRHIFPGSWINANFDVWIGAEEDNQAWSQLLLARKAYEQAKSDSRVPQADLRLAYEELLIAEGSDWCWWYGPEHHSDNRPEFDQLFRDHVANVYRALKFEAPVELSRPILRETAPEHYEPPMDPVRAVIDGELTSYFEWMGSGLYKPDTRSGAMHSGPRLVREVRFGSDFRNLYVMMEPEDPTSWTGLELRILWNDDEARIQLDPAGCGVRKGPKGTECAMRRVLEVRVPTGPGAVRFRVSIWRDGVPLENLPQHGWLMAR
jgi:alpha-amylase/alpha-mannosidase (GH57 family)